VYLVRLLTNNIDERLSKGYISNQKVARPEFSVDLHLSLSLRLSVILWAFIRVFLTPN
jgi:hypothetical protein